MVFQPKLLYLEILMVDINDNLLKVTIFFKNMPKNEIKIAKKYSRISIICHRYNSSFFKLTICLYKCTKISKNCIKEYLVGENISFITVDNFQ